jgi:hypothetical protein
MQLPKNKGFYSENKLSKKSITDFKDKEKNNSTHNSLQHIPLKTYFIYFLLSK